MFKKLLFRAVVAVVAVVGLGAGLAAPASAARPVRPAHMLSMAGVVAVYPGMAGGLSSVGPARLKVPHATRHHGLRCDSTRSYAGSTRMTGLYYDKRSAGPNVVETVIRFPSARRAHGILNKFRSYARTCHGTHGRVSDTRVNVSGFGTRAAGHDSVGFLQRFRAREGGWSYRTVAVRKGRTLVALTIGFAHGSGKAGQAIRLARRAVARAA